MANQALDVTAVNAEMLCQHLIPTEHHAENPLM